MDFPKTLQRQGHHLLQWGVVFFIFSALEGFFIGGLSFPRLGLSVHTLSALEGVMFIAIGLVWPRLHLGRRSAPLAWWTYVYSSLATLVPYVLAAVWGAGNKAMPLAAGLAQGTAFQELTIQIILYSAAPTYFVSILLVLWGLRVPPAA